VRGDLPPHKCRAALDSVVFVEEPWQEESGSVLADIVAHLGQDVSILDPLFFCCCYAVWLLS
jgi:THO complex subunit 2